MHIVTLQHVPFEGPAAIASWAEAAGHTFTSVHLYRGDPLPPIAMVDFLVVMGGPMSVGDVEAFPWLLTERQYIRDIVDNGKLVLGVCLGAQLIAASLGAEITKNAYREIGWFPLTVAAELADTVLADVFSNGLEVFHWHGDTFAIPAGAVRLASSEACRNQGFVYGKRVVALQFHIETTPQSAQALLDHCADELDGTRYVQDAATLLADASRFQRINTVLYRLLDALTATP